MDKTITVYYQGSALLVYKVVADRLHLRQGQVLQTEAHLWDVLRQNATHGLLMCQHQLGSTN